MKLLQSLIRHLTIASISLTPILAQSEFDPLGEAAEAVLPKLIRVQVEFIEIPHEKMTELLAEPGKSANDTELRAKLQELLKAGKATMLETQLGTTRSGQLGKVESIEEFIYPTEYEPSELPTTVNIDGTETGKNTESLSTPPTPTAFETRNLGSTLEFEPILGEDNKTVDLRLAPEIVYHPKNTVWAEWADKKAKANIEMPVMYSLRFSTGLVVTSGQTFLAAALSPKDEKGSPDFTRKILVFVRADVLTVGR